MVRKLSQVPVKSLGAVKQVAGIMSLSAAIPEQLNAQAQVIYFIISNVFYQQSCIFRLL